MAKKSNVKDKNSKKSRNNSLIHKILIALAFFLIIGGLLGGYIAHSLFSPNISVENDKKEYLLVYENECYDDILSQLENKNLLKSVITFKTASWILNSKKEFKPGRYQLSNEMKFDLWKTNSHQYFIQQRENKGDISRKDYQKTKTYKRGVPSRTEFCINSRKFRIK